MLHKLQILSGVSLLAVLAASCSPASPASAPAAQSSGPASAPVSQPRGGTGKLVIGGYSTPREAFGEILPLFRKYWKDKSGQDVDFQESYQGSGAQSRAVVNGFEADLVALSLEDDVNRIQKAGLITQDWKTQSHKGILTNSVVVLAVRKGNPKGIHDWKDLAQPGLAILTPDPKTSGGAMWNILALYDAARRGGIGGVAKDDDAAAKNFLISVAKNITVMDKDARTSLTTFEKGIGDVAVTYENEVIAGRQSGQDYEYVVPHSTILIEAPAAVVDQYARKHGMLDAANGFLQYLWTPDAQRVFAKHGFRSVEDTVAKETASQFPAVQDLFTIDYFGGWSKATPAVFGDSGVFTTALQQVQGAK